MAELCSIMLSQPVLGLRQAAGLHGCQVTGELLAVSRPGDAMGERWGQWSLRRSTAADPQDGIAEQQFLSLLRSDPSRPRDGTAMTRVKAET